MDLALRATDVPLDEILARALPAEARERYVLLNPAGRIDLDGRLFRREEGERVEYDLRVSVADGAFNLPGTAARLENAVADLHLLPGQLNVKSLTGRFGQAKIDLQARVGMSQRDKPMSLFVKCQRLPLDEALYGALPLTLRKAWDSLKPGGAVGLDLRYQRPAPTTRPADDTGSAVDYTVTIEPKDCRAAYAGFPLPLTSINGQLVVTPGKVEIEEITARHEQTRLEVKGEIALQPERTHVVLSRIKATGLTFSEALRQAVPWRVRRVWNNVKPRGTIDLTLNRLEGDVKAGPGTVWAYDAEVMLHDVSAEVGAELTGIEGSITGQGQIGGGFSIEEGTIRLDRALVDGRMVTRAKAKPSLAATAPVLRVEEIVGDFYGGKIVGRVEVDYSAAAPEYGLSLTAREVSLGGFLNAKRKPEQKPLELKGQIEGNLVLTGRLGDPRTRRGGGTILIQRAEVLKLPFLLSILQVIHFAIGDDNAFHDATIAFIVAGDELILEEIDLRGKALSMVGAGRVKVSTQAMDLILLVGSPLRLPRIEVLTELLEGVARELMEVRVEGTLDKPVFRADIVRSVRKTLDAILKLRLPEPERR